MFPRKDRSKQSMRPEIRELVVLQIIYSLLVGKFSQQELPTGGADCKVSLVKLTNEIQNNALIRQMVDTRREDRLDINDILDVVKSSFPGHRTSLNDGQLSFHNLSMDELKELIHDRYEMFISSQIKRVHAVEEKILDAQKSSSSSSSNGGGGAAAAAALARADPKREKLLQLYRDTVLNKLQGKNKILDELYKSLGSENAEVVVDVIDLDRIKSDTPKSVHELQLTLQKSICDSIARSPIGSENWKLARQVQLDFDDTVQFMRRALE